MLRNLKLPLFHNVKRSVIYSLERQIRGAVASKDLSASSSPSGSSILHNQQEGGYRPHFGVHPAADPKAVDESRKVGSFYGHPRKVFLDNDEDDDKSKKTDAGEGAVSPPIFVKQPTIPARFDVIEEEQLAVEPLKNVIEQNIIEDQLQQRQQQHFQALPRPVPAPKRKSRAHLHTYTLTPLVNDSELLRNLVDVGVNLSKFDTLHNVADWLIKLDWSKDVQPVMQFLNETGGIPLEGIGAFITANPWILQQSLDDLRVRVQYLVSKKFSPESIHRIVNKAAYWLNFHVKTIDKRLGFLQKTFQLTGDEVRFVVTHSPKLVTIGTGYTELLLFSFQEEMGFKKEELHQLIVKDPRLFLTPRPMLSKAFNYLHNEMKFSHQTILQWPSILRAQPHYLRQRHTYLKSLGRDQYDPTKPNYVPLQALSAISDLEFATNVAKTSIAEFNKFMKKKF